MKRFMRIQGLLFVSLFLVLLAGCATKVGTEKESSGMRMQGLVNGYVSVNALEPYDGNILTFGILGKETQHGEVVSVDLWPLLGLGVGVVGVRTRVLFLDTGVGLLFYDPPPPPRRQKSAEPKKKEENTEGNPEPKADSEEAG